MKVKNLARVRVLPTEENDVRVIALTDTTGKETRFAITPEGLHAVLLPALALADQWAELPDLHIDELTAPARYLPATGISFLRGHTATEALLLLAIGRVRLAFSLPLDSMLSAMATLVQNIEPDNKPH